MTPAEAAAYNPPLGINITWLEFIPDKQQVIAEFTASPLQPDPVFRKSMADIRHELATTWRNRLLEDNLGSHPNSPRRIMVIESILNHPFLTGEAKSMYRQNELLPSSIQLTTPELKKAAETAIDVKEIEMSPQEAEVNLRLGSTGQKLDVQPKEVRQHRYLEQIMDSHGSTSSSTGRSISERYREKYGPERYVYLVGVVDSG